MASTSSPGLMPCNAPRTPLSVFSSMVSRSIVTASASSPSIIPAKSVLMVPNTCWSAIAHQLDDPAVMARDQRVDEFGPDSLEPGDGPRLVGLHHPRVAHDIGRDDRKQ